MPTTLIAIYLKELSLKSLYGLFVLIVSVIINDCYVVYSTSLDRNSKYHKGLRYEVLGPHCFIVLATIILIANNLRMNFKFRNLRFKTPLDNPIVLYLITIPILIFSISGLVIISIDDVYRFKCLGYLNFFYEVILTLLLIMIMILLIDISGMEDTGEQWSLNLSNAATLMFTITTLLNVSLYNLIQLHVSAIGTTFERYLNSSILGKCVDDHDPVGTSIHMTLNILLRFFEPMKVIFSTCCMPFLITQLLRHLRILEGKLQTEYGEVDQPISPVQTSLLTSTGAMFNMLVIGICTYSYIEGTRVPTSLYSGLLCIHYIFNCFIIIMMVIEIKDWPHIGQSVSFVSHLYVWVGLLGQLITTISRSCISIHILIKYHDQASFVYIGRYILETVEVLMQAVLLSLILDRKPHGIREKSWSKVFMSPLYLIISNVNFIIFENWSSYLLPKSRLRFYQEIFTQSILSFGRPLMSLFRMYFILIFLKIWLKQI